MVDAWQGQEAEVSALSIILPLIPWVLIIVVIWVLFIPLFRKTTHQTNRAIEINEIILENEKLHNQQLEKALRILEEIRDNLKRQGPT